MSESSSNLSRRRFLERSLAYGAVAAAPPATAKAVAASAAKRSGDPRFSLWCAPGGLISPTQPSDEAGRHRLRREVRPPWRDPSGSDSRVPDPGPGGPGEGDRDASLHGVQQPWREADAGQLVPQLHRSSLRLCPAQGKAGSASAHLEQPPSRAEHRLIRQGTSRLVGAGPGRRPRTQAGEPALP